MNEASPKPQNKQRPAIIAAAIIVVGILGFLLYNAVPPQAGSADLPPYNASENLEEQQMWTEEEMAIYRKYKLKELEEIERERRLRTAAPLAPDKMEPNFK
jgi:hypothetical protein